MKREAEPTLCVLVFLGFTGLQTPLWKRELRDFALFPQYHYQSTMWEVKLNAGIIKKETSETDAIK